jgi:hypothetical protein
MVWWVFTSNEELDEISLFTCVPNVIGVNWLARWHRKKNRWTEIPFLLRFNLVRFVKIRQWFNLQN